MPRNDIECLLDYASDFNEILREFISRENDGSRQKKCNGNDGWAFAENVLGGYR